MSVAINNTFPSYYSLKVGKLRLDLAQLLAGLAGGRKADLGLLQLGLEVVPFSSQDLLLILQIVGALISSL